MNQHHGTSSDHGDTQRWFSVDEFMAMGAAGIFGPDERLAGWVGIRGLLAAYSAATFWAAL
jgi:hypothetical protein